MTASPGTPAKTIGCWKCGAALQNARIGFRAVCEACDADLHCCLNCRFYAPGRPNECMVPGTDFIADRTKNNFCEEFALKVGESKSSIRKEDAKKRFNDLFKD